MTWRGDSVSHQDVFCVLPANQLNKWEDARRCCENHKWREAQEGFRSWCEISISNEHFTNLSLTWITLCWMNRMYFSIHAHGIPPTQNIGLLNTKSWLECYVAKWMTFGETSVCLPFSSHRNLLIHLSRIVSGEDNFLRSWRNLIFFFPLEHTK